MFRLGTSIAFGLILAAGVLPLCGTASAQQATLERVKRTGVITLCADPDRLPYSSEKLNPPGFDVEVAQEIANSLGVKLGYNWFSTRSGSKALRQLVTEGGCDFFLGLPSDENFQEQNFKLMLSKPYYVGGFATIARADAAASILQDSKTKGVGVQMGTLPDFKLFDRGFERKLYKNASEMLDAVVHKEIDAAVAAAPEAGWLVKQKADAGIKVLTNSEKEFLFPMAAGVRKADKDLKALIDETIDKITASGKLKEILAKYGMVQLAAEGAAAPTAQAQPEQKKEEPKKEEPKKEEPKKEEPKKEGEAKPADKAAAAPADHSHMAGAMEILPDDQVVDPKKFDDFPSDFKTLDSGRKLYKQACYKCHGPNGVSGGTIPDLRIYAGKHDHYEMFAVVQGGRLDRGMPRWADYLTEEEIKSIVVYVKALPKK